MKAREREREREREKEKERQREREREREKLRQGRDSNRDKCTGIHRDTDIKTEADMV